MRLTLSGRLRLDGAPPALAAELCDRLSVPNEAYHQAVKQGRYAGHLPERLSYVRAMGPTSMELPRGTVALVRHLAREHGLHLELVDRTLTLPEVDFNFSGSLRDYQAEALAQVTRWPCATLQSPTGSGKTCMALAAIAHRRQPTLVVVHTSTLLNQWLARAESFLGLSRDEIGVVGGGRCTVGERLTIGVINSVAEHTAELAPHIGHLIVDECHRSPGRRYAKTIGSFPARYVLGLSATPWRSDGLSDVVSWLLGPTHRVSSAPLVESGHVLPAEVRWVETTFSSTVDVAASYSQALSELTADDDRNALVALQVAQVARELPGVVLVLSDRRAHCEALQGLLQAQGIDAAVLTGDLSPKVREAVLSTVRNGEARVMVATAQLVGEGFDLPEIAAVVLATPARFDGRVLQAVGRALRPAPGKQVALVLDFLDHREPVFAASARARSKVYQRLAA